MPADHLEFSIAPPPDNRSALIEEAAQYADALPGYLAEGVNVETTAGATIRALENDIAELAVYPDVYQIHDSDFLSKGLPSPIPFADEAHRSKFLWIRFPLGLAAQRGWNFNLLELKVQFTGPENPQLKAKAHQILPDRKFQDQLKGDMGVTLRLDENLEFQVSTKPVPGTDAIPLQGSVDAKVAAQAGLIAGPFTYRLARAKIEHTSTGLDWVFWRLDGAEFFQETTPDLIVIARVPREATELGVRAELRAARHFQFATADLRDAVAQFGIRLKRFFQDEGAVLGDSKVYDLSSAL